MAQNNAPAKKENVVSEVMAYVNKLQRKGDLLFPKNYSPKNALMSAWLILQNTTTKDKRPVLQACDRASIFQSLLEMVTLGLNPSKDQCYFIAYKNRLNLQVSRYGYEAMAKRTNPKIDKIIAEVVWEGDEFEYEIRLGEKYITKHIQKLTNKNRQPVGAYCVLLDKEGKVLKTTIKTFEQIKQAWKKSPSNPFKENGELKKDSTHAQFIEEMTIRTIIKMATKQTIKSSDDAYLFNQINQIEQQQNVQQEEEEMEDIIEAETATVDFDEEVEKQVEEEKPKQGGKKDSSPQKEDLGEDPGF